MYNTNYNYGLNKKINKIIMIQTYWRKYKLSNLLKYKNNISTDNLILADTILKKILKIDVEYKIIPILIKNINLEFYICDNTIISILKIYQSYLFYSIIFKTYNIFQLKKNIEKYFILIIINNLKCDFDKLYMKVSDLSKLTNEYIYISSLKINNKLEILKKILNEHIKIVEDILIEYNNLGHQLIFENIKILNNTSYFTIYNKFIQYHNITNNYFNYNNFYSKILSFITYNNIYDFLYINDINIKLKKKNSFNDKLNIIYSFLN
jgi:hypothetical protein